MGRFGPGAPCIKHHGLHDAHATVCFMDVYNGNAHMLEEVQRRHRRAWILPYCHARHGACGSGEVASCNEHNAQCVISRAYNIIIYIYTMAWKFESE